MSWFQEHKFLSGLIGITVLGVGVLGYFTYDATSRYDAANQSLEEKANEKKRLETLPVYPNQKNLDAVNELKGNHLQRIEELQQKLSGMEIPEDTITPEAFQDELRRAVTEYVEVAGKKHLVLPSKFYMGFDQYQNTIPRPEAAPKLSRELKAIAFVLQQLASNNAQELKSVLRGELPEENTRAEKKSEPKNAKGAKKADELPELVKRSPFEIDFICEQTALQRTLDDIVGAKSQFYIIRNLAVKNEKPSPPVRGETGADQPPADAPPTPGEGAAPAAPVPGAPAKPQGITVIVGEERVEVTMLLEVADFVAPESKAERKAERKANRNK